MQPEHGVVALQAHDQVPKVEPLTDDCCLEGQNPMSKYTFTR